jgi:two-component system chemotaxis response regulator CheB
VESMLYQSMRGLEESKMLLQSLGNYFAKDGQQQVADAFFVKATQTGQQARIMHDSINNHDIFSGDKVPHNVKGKP